MAPNSNNRDRWWRSRKEGCKLSNISRKICGKERPSESVFASPQQQVEIQDWAIQNPWSKYPLKFGARPAAPYLTDGSPDGAWILVTHFGDDPEYSAEMIIEAINAKSCECGTGITMVLHDDVKDVIRQMRWHHKKPKVLSIVEVTQEWVWVSFKNFAPNKGMVAKDVIENLVSEYPAGNEALCAILFCDELADIITGDEFPEIIMPGFSVTASINNEPMQEYCLKAVSYKPSAKKTIVRLLLHPIDALTMTGVVVTASQYLLI